MKKRGDSIGQAFDESGKLLGSVFGTTKREVFDELAEKFPEAHEIRVYALKLVANPPIAPPRYRSRRMEVVWALKIAEVREVKADGSAEMVPADTGHEPFTIEAPWERERFKGNKKDFGYYICYADGREDWLPSKRFEGDYTRL